jgi:hypothetical protein
MWHHRAVGGPPPDFLNRLAGSFFFVARNRVIPHLPYQERFLFFSEIFLVEDHPLRGGAKSKKGVGNFFFVQTSGHFFLERGGGDWHDNSAKKKLLQS